MKKRLLSLLLTVCLVAALFTGLTGTANAADDKVMGYLTSYTLKAGDTIYGVCEAKKIDFNSNLATIGKINGITNYNYMMPGKVLWLPTKTASTSEAYYSLLAHTLVAGETPAALCQSYGIDYNTNYKLLAALNNNLNVFMAGQQFILPLYVTPAGAATPTPAPSAGTSAAPTATPKPGTTPAPTANVPSGDTVSYYLAQHTLQYGETVSGVCAALGVDFSTNDATIRKINNIANYNYMMPGKVILIPTKTVPGSGSYYKIMAHKIVSGDTLYALCASYGLDYYAYSKLISLLNPNAAYYNLLPGNILYMPQYVAASTTVKPAATPAPAASAGTTAAPAATPAPSASAGTTASAAPSASAAASAKATTAPNIPAEDTLSYLIIPHKIQAGDTVISICDKYKVDFAANDAAIQRLNPSVSYSYLLPGNIILVPSTSYPSSGPYYKIMAHKLVAGDTVYDLCLTYGLSYENNITFLQRLNNRDNLATYYVGQTIYMPLYVAG